MENIGLKGLFVTLYHRVILSWETSLIGFGIDIVGVTLDYFAKSPSGIISKVALVLGTIFMLIKQNLAQKYPGKFPTAAAAAVIACLFLPGFAFAQETPRGGGCLENKTTCFGPSFGVTVATVDLKTGKVDTTFAPGAGYGATWFVGKWYETGTAGYISLRPADSGQRVVGSVMLTFAKYLRVGLAQQFGDKSDQKRFLLFGLGSDFGSSSQ